MNILKKDYGSRRQDKPKVTELWEKVFTELNRDPIS
jgi:hypothetical protein